MEVDGADPERRAYPNNDTQSPPQNAQSQQQREQQQASYDFLHYHRGKPLSESAPAFRFRGRLGGAPGAAATAAAASGFGGGSGGAAGEGDGDGSLLLCNIRPQVCRVVWLCGWMWCGSVVWCGCVIVGWVGGWDGGTGELPHAHHLATLQITITTTPSPTAPTDSTPPYLTHTHTNRIHTTTGRAGGGAAPVLRGSGLIFAPARGGAGWFGGFGRARIHARQG